MSEEFLRDIASTVDELEERRKKVSSRVQSSQRIVLTEEELNKETSSRQFHSEEVMLEKRRMEVIRAIRDLLEELEHINNKIRELRTRELLSMGDSNVVDIDIG